MYYTVTLHYAFPERSRNQGFGSEITKGIAKFAFEELGQFGVKELAAKTLPYNTISQVLLMKIGIQPVGTVKCECYKAKNCTVYSISKENYEALKDKQISSAEFSLHPKTCNFNHFIEKQRTKTLNPGLPIEKKNAYAKRIADYETIKGRLKEVERGI